MNSQSADIHAAVGERPAEIIGYRLPVALWIVFGIGTPIFLVAIGLCLFDTNQPDVALLIAVLGGGNIAFLYFNNSSYRIGWDDRQIWMRGWGIWKYWARRPWHGLTYDRIVAIEGRFQNRDMTAFSAFEYLALVPDGMDEEIWLYPESLEKTRFREFLAFFRDRRPDLFDEELMAALRTMKLAD